MDTSFVSEFRSNALKGATIATRNPEIREDAAQNVLVRILKGKKIDPDGAAKNPLDIISHALQLRTAAGQNNLTADRPCKAKILERLGNLTHQMLQPLADHGNQLRTGDTVAFALIIGRKRGDIDHIMIVAWTCRG